MALNDDTFEKYLLLKKWLVKGKISTERLMYLVNDILDLSYFEAGKISTTNE